MEAALGVASLIAPKLFDLLENNHNLRGQLVVDIELVRCEFELISAAIQEHDDGLHGGRQEAAWICGARQLAHAIEDCVDRFTHRVKLRPNASLIHRVKTLKARDKFAAAIRDLRRESLELSNRRKRFLMPNLTAKEVVDLVKKCGEPVPEEEETPVDAKDVDLVGMEEPYHELIELMREMPQVQSKEKVKVISLLGFGGIGKSQPAWQVYNSPAIVGQYTRAWVRAAEKGAHDVLKDILSELGASTDSSCRDSFIVIDDMRVEFWDEIKGAFPVPPGVCTRVVVTTDFQPIAKKCSFPDGHVYVVRTLNEQHSRKLFLDKSSLYSAPPGDMGLGSQVIKKCDGLPLALVTTARMLHGDPTPEDWTNLAENLGKHLEEDYKLRSMNRVLVRSYTSLGSQDVKRCLLYLGIYPSGHPIRKGSLIRKWLAEGLIQQDLGLQGNALSAAVNYFKELVNRSIIQPIDASNSDSTLPKSWQTHGMMLEFILYKSMRDNFVTLLCGKDSLPRTRGKIRWLSLHQKSAARVKMSEKDICLVRSLTIFGSAHKSMLDFSKYELLRVLDLEESDDELGDSQLKVICSKLLLLKYLSLGGATTATVLPKEIKKLQLLETLDLRRTKIELLPAQVLDLPCLVHLFGKFKLQGVRDQRMSKLQTWMSENSKLETVAGFVIDKSPEVPQLMDHMVHLKKVKIWCKSTTDASGNLGHLSKSIKGFIQRGTGPEKALSLSLNINDEWSQDFLDSSMEMDYSNYLRSLKLQGGNICSYLPRFVTMLGGLTKLCLLFRGCNLSGDLLAVLSNVRGLKYLKMIAAQMDKLVIKHNKLENLQHLCVEVEVMNGLEIEEGVLLCLQSLQLLCKDLNGFCGATTIQYLGCLKEVALHDGLSDETKHEWKEAAKNHPRHPKLLFKPMEREPRPVAGMNPALAAADTLVQEVVAESAPVENSESPVAPPTDMPLPVTTPSGAISTGESGESVRCVTSEMGRESAAEIPVALATTDNVKAVKHDTFTNAQQEYSGQVDGDGQHDDHGIEDIDNTHGPNDLASENGPRTIMASVKKEMDV